MTTYEEGQVVSAGQRLTAWQQCRLRLPA